MDFSRRSFPLASFNPTRQKRQNVQTSNFTRSSVPNAASFPSQVANLKQCISAYLDSIQMVCRAGTWLAETLSCLLNEPCYNLLACEMKSKFTKMMEVAIASTMQARNDLAMILMDLSLPNPNSKNRLQGTKNFKLHNEKILEKCIQCLSDVHNSFFKVQLDIGAVTENESPVQQNDKGVDSDLVGDFMNGVVHASGTNTDYSSEWEKLKDATMNITSWRALNKCTSCLRKYNGLTENEIQNLLKDEKVSQLYLEKLNQRIDTALRNYEVGLRGLPSEAVVFGAFSSSPDNAKIALQGCCSKMEMEQETQRLPVSQFLHCELPLMSVLINNKDFSADTNNSLQNINLKKNAVRLLLQPTKPKLSISETDDLSYEILGDVCPARWRTHVKACLQLLYGNSGLVIMDTTNNESNTKRSAVISRKENFVVVSITSTWCVKEDPGTMSLLQRNLDPEKTLAIINVRYVSVFQNKPSPGKGFDPGIFVETFVQTGSQNRRRASQTLRKTQTLSGVPLTSMSSCWLTGRSPEVPSPVLMTRITSPSVNEASNVPPASTAGSSSPNRSYADAKSERKQRTKKLVVEIKESDTASEEEKSSDNDDSVKEVIHMLSGISRPSFRRRNNGSEKLPNKTADDMQNTIKSSPQEKSVNTQAKVDKVRVQTPALKDCAIVEGVDVQERKNVSTQVAFSVPVFLPRNNISPYAPFYSMAKSQTLPGTFGGNSQSQPDHPMRGLSYTLPTHGRNFNGTAAPDNPICGYQTHITSQSFHLPAGEVMLPAVGLPARPLVSTDSSPASETNVQSNFPPSGIGNIIGVGVSAAPSYSLWTHETALTDTKLRHGNSCHRSALCDNSYNHVPGVLQSTKNLSANSDSLAQQPKPDYGDRYRQDRLISGHNQIGMVQNSNNNNGTPSNGLETAHKCSQRQNSAVHRNMSENNVSASDQNGHICGKGLSKSQFKNNLSVQEVHRNSEHMSDHDHFVLAQSHETLGPIGSPVSRKQAGIVPMQLWQKNSNTWPNLYGLENKLPDPDSGDQDYKKYIVEVSKNAINRRQLSQNYSGKPAPQSNPDCWANEDLWRIVDSSELEQGIKAEFEGPLSVASEASVMKNHGGVNAGALGFMEGVDASRTGTWPPWQLWSAGSSGMWNWGSDALMMNFQKNIDQ